MKNKAVILSTGLALFSIFFGSGNLVFPLLVGQLSKGHYILATLGILLTGVLVPFLGILAMLLFKGKRGELFSLLGKYAPFWLSLVCLSIMGPFGVLARCITVAHGAFELIWPGASLWLFSLISCAVIFGLSVKKSKIVSLLGSILTPFLLVSLGLVACFALFYTELPAASASGSWSSFKTGIFEGYQTMDLLAAFFFATFIIKHLEKRFSAADDPAKTIPVFFRASLIGAGLLALVYAILVTLGAMYAPTLDGLPPEEMLGEVARQSLGAFAAPLVCVSVIFACLTTAIVLASLFADFLEKEVLKNRINHTTSLGVTLLLAFGISTLEFSGIASYLKPILSVLYPALIVLAVLGIFHKLWGWKAVRMPVAVTLTVKLLSSL